MLEAKERWFISFMPCLSAFWSIWQITVGNRMLDLIQQCSFYVFQLFTPLYIDTDKHEGLAFLIQGFLEQNIELAGVPYGLFNSLLQRWHHPILESSPGALMEPTS